MRKQKVLFAGCLIAACTVCRAAPPDDPAPDVLTPDQWQRVDTSVDRALQWLAGEQQRDGSFPTLPQGQPGVTSLCVMAFTAHGHLPGEGPFGKQLNQAVDFILSCQKPNGLLAQAGPRGITLSRNVTHEIGTTASYDHAISALLLSEVFSMGQGTDRERMQTAIESALQVTLEMQQWPKERAADKGGWRYVDDFNNHDSDLSVSGWHLMFLRSAKNAGFEVPRAPIAEAVDYVRRCYRPRFGAFLMIADDDMHRSRGMAGAGILALAHAGLHDSPEARKAGDWILANDFGQYNQVRDYDRPLYPDDRYHYGVFLCTQAMYQLGGSYWQRFYPPTVRVLLDNQDPQGSWQAERHKYDRKFGNAYSTAMVVLTLGAPNQLLPIFQR